MTDLELKRIKNRLDNSTIGDWKATSKYGTITSNTGKISVTGIELAVLDAKNNKIDISNNDINFIINAKTDIANLIKEIERLKELNMWIPITDQLHQITISVRKNTI